LMTVVGQDEQASAVTLTAEPDSVATYKIFVRVPREALLAGSSDFHFILSERVDGGGEVARYDAAFIGPDR